MEIIGLLLGVVFWPTALIAWLVISHFAIRKFGRTARIVRNLGVCGWVVLVVLIGCCVGKWLFLDEPLACAACNGDLRQVRTLLAWGADPDSSAEDGSPAIAEAAYNGHAEIVRELIRHGADVNAKGDSEQTALTFAKDNNYTDIVRMLKRAGARE